MPTAAALRDATLPLLEPGRPLTGRAAEVLAMGRILVDAQDEPVGHARSAAQLTEGEQWTAQGLAVSPASALLCVQDVARTVGFLRGIDLAIQDARAAHPGRPVRVLYAGCGPLATLGAPLMAVHGPEAVQFTLVEIHPASARSARSVIASLGLSGALADLVVGDIADLRLDPAALPDVIVMEVMYTTLEGEPQVELTRRLVGQAPDARFVPASITVDLRLIDGARELPGDPRPPRHVRLGDVFVVDKEAVAEWAGITDGVLPGARLRLPRAIDPELTPMLCTAIETWGGLTLGDSESTLTAPRRLAVEAPPGSALTFAYETGAFPGLRVDVAPPGWRGLVHRARGWLGRG